MRSVTASLAAAITARERTIRPKVSVDWDNDGHGAAGSLDDISGNVESLSVQRSTTGTIPDDVQVTEGVSAATASCALVGGVVGDETVGTVQYWSRFNTASPLYGKPRIARDVNVSAEFLTSAGYEAVPLITGGRLNNIPVSAAAQTAGFEVIDARDKLRTLVHLPAMIADGPIECMLGPGAFNSLNPGLEVSWIASYALFCAEYYVAPAPDLDHCIMYIPFHGSAQPFVQRDNAGTAGIGVLITGTTWYQEKCTFTDDAPFFLACDPAYYHDLDPDATITGRASCRGVSTSMWSSTGRSTGRIEVRVKALSSRGATQVLIQPDSDAGVNEHMIQLILSSSGATTLVVTNGATVRTVSGPTVTMDGSWHRLGCHWDDSAGRSVFIWDNATTLALFTATPAGSYVRLDDTQMYVESELPLAELSIMTGQAEGDSWIPLTYTATCEIDRLYNRNLAGIWPAEPVGAWDLLQEVVGAEYGLCWIDSGGIPQVWSRSRLSSATGLTSQRTVTGSSDIVDIAYDDRAAQTRNIVRCSYQGMSLSYALDSTWSVGVLPVWELPEIDAIAPGGTWTQQIELEFPICSLPYVFGQCMEGTISGITSPSVTHTITGNFATAPLVIDVSVLSLIPDGNDTRCLVELSITNNHTTWIWLEYFDGADYVPGIGLYAGVLKQDVRQTREIRDATSIATYGELPLAVSESRWHQTAGMAEGVCAGLVTALKGEQYTITNLEIAGDPRLELWDRITVTDSHATMLDSEQIIDGIDTTVGVGCDQSLVVRPARDLWVLGGVGVGTGTGTTIVGDGL